MNDLSLFSLDGSVALVTGASSGIGHEVAIGLAQAGAATVAATAAAAAARAATERAAKVARRERRRQRVPACVVAPSRCGAWGGSRRVREVWWWLLSVVATWY